MASTMRIGVLVVLLSCLLAAGACDDCASARSGGSTTSEPPQPAQRPTTTRAELHLRGGTSFLGALREQIGRGVVAAASPRTPGDLLGRLIELPEGLEARVLPDSPVEGILLGESDPPQRVFAARLRLEQDAAHPLGPEFALGDPVPNDHAVAAHFIGSGSAPAMALAADVLVAGDTREAVQTALPWLVTQAMMAERPLALTISLEPGLVSRSLHAIARAALQRFIRDARRDLEAERGRHDAAPELADPEAVLAWVERKAWAVVALLPDVGEVTLTLTSEAAGPTIDLRASVAPGSPLAATLASLRAFPTNGLARMPVTAALRLMFASGPADEANDGESTLGSLLGDRLSAEQRRALLAVGDALHDGSSARGLASGTSEGQSFVVYLDRSNAQVDLAAALRSALASTWLKHTLGLALGCEGAPPRVVEDGDTLRLGACPGVATRELVFAHSQATRALLLTPTQAQDPSAAAQHMVDSFASEARVLGLDPASQRLLAGLPSPSVFAALVHPTELLPSVVGLLRPAPSPSDGPSAPLALAVRVEPGALHARLILAPGAASNVGDVGLGLLRAATPPSAGPDPDRTLRNPGP